MLSSGKFVTDGVNGCRDKRVQPDLLPASSNERAFIIITLTAVASLLQANQPALTFVGDSHVVVLRCRSKVNKTVKVE